MNTENVSTLKIHKLTKEQYDRELANGRVDPNALYFTTTEDEEIDLSEYATQTFVTNKIAEAQLSGGGDGSTIDLSGYATKDDLNTIDFPVDSINGQTGAVKLVASDVGAVPTTRTVNGKALSSNISLTASDVSALSTSGGRVDGDIYLGGEDSTENYDLYIRRVESDVLKSGRLYWDGSTFKVNAASGGTTFNYLQLKEDSTVLNKPLTVASGGTGATSAAAALANLGAAASDHTHSYAGSSSAGGAANSVKTNLTVKLNDGSIEGTDLFTYNGSTAKTINVTPSAIGAASLEYAKKVGAPRNLLVNSYWMEKDKVVNQRNASSYTGIKHTIDRWESKSPNLTVTLPTDSNRYLTLKNDTAGDDRQTFSQYIGPASQYVGKTLTVAICGRSDKVSCFSKEVPELTGESQNFCSVHFDIVDEEAGQCHAARLNINESGDLYFIVMVYKAQTANLRWAAVYEGEYTEDTLPEYKPNDYVHELMECKLCCQRLSIYGGFRCFKYDANCVKFLVPVPLRMRVKPSIESGTMSVKNLSGTTQSDFTFSVGSFGENYIIIDATKSGHGLTDAYLYFDSNVIMSADYL